VKKQDQNYNPVLTAKDDIEDEPGIPQTLFMENVLPTDYGYTSLHYSIPSTGKMPGEPSFSFTVRSSTTTKILVQNSLFDVYNLTDLTAAGEPTYVGNLPGTLTYVTISGVTYIYVANVGCYTYNFTLNQFDPVTLSGLDVTSVIGITGVQGYMLAWSSDAIAWSSVTDPTDFVPSLETGAGGGSVEGAKGALTVCVPNSLGIFVFTQQNCVSALFSNNARFPFNFKEIAGSLGCASVEDVTYETTLGVAYVLTVLGIQQVAHNGAKFVHQHLTQDNATWSELEDGTWGLQPTLVSWIGGAGTATSNSASRLVPSTSKLVVVGARYLCVSVGGSPGYVPYQVCHVYDMVLKRWGRINIPHYEVFDLLDDTSIPGAHTNIGLINSEQRSVTKIYTSPTQAWSSDYPETQYSPSITLSEIRSRSRIIFGRFQYTREEFLELHEVEVENLKGTTDFGSVNQLEVSPEGYINPKVYVQGSLDGKTGSYVEYTINTADSVYAPKFQGRSVGKTVSVCIEGAFKLNTLVLSFNPKVGRR
jgi:hypothetical protein